MKPLKYTVAALALVAAASFTQSAMAASTGDLILGVYDSNEPTTLPSYELDLGSFSTVTATTNGTETWTLTGLESTFSSDSSASLVFDIAATGNSITGTAGGLAAKQVAFTATSLPTFTTNNTTEITNIGAETNAYVGGSQSGAGSFETEINSNGGNYGFGGGSNQPGELLSSYTYGSDVDLYTRVGTSSSASAVVAGTFVLSDVNGNDILTFDPAAAVPEPSAYALGLCAVALFFVLKRRRSAA